MFTEAPEILEEELNQEANDSVDAGLYNFVLEYYNTKDKNSSYYSYAALRKCWYMMDKITSSSDIEPGLNTQAKVVYTFVHLGQTKAPELNSQDAINFAIEYFNIYPHPFSKQILDSLFSYLEKDKNIINLLINDAINSVNFTENFEERMNLLRMEWAHKYNNKNTDDEWVALTLGLLNNASFYLPYSKTYYENTLLLNRLKLDKKWAKINTKKKEAAKPPIKPPVIGFEHVEKGSPSRGTQTYFRTTFSNHLKLNSIADNKAHIMISVNSILISILISLMTYKSLTDYNPAYLLPILVCLMSALTSLIFAIISAKPKALTPGAPNLVFFSSFAKMSQEKFEIEVEKMFRDSNTLYSNMVKGIHDIGIVLDKKYAALRYAYNVFMFGFIITVLSFLFAYFQTK